MKKKRRRRWASITDDSISVPLSPLIDCVFLLLIFFLVTSMMKKMEKQIPIILPDITSKLGDKPDEKLHIIGLKNNQFYVASSNKDWHGKYHYYPISDFSKHLKDLPLGQFSSKEFPIRIDADREVTIQKIIDTLDICSIQGFENIQLHLYNDEYQPLQKKRRRRNWREGYYQ